MVIHHDLTPRRIGVPAASSGFFFRTKKTDYFLEIVGICMRLYKDQITNNSTKRDAKEVVRN